MPDYPYNITRMMNETAGLADLARQTNVILGGFYFGYFTLAIIGIVVFVYLKRIYHPLTCAAGSAWVMMLTSIFLRSLGLIDNLTFWICIMLVPLSIFALWLSWRD